MNANRTKKHPPSEAKKRPKLPKPHKGKEPAGFISARQAQTKLTREISQKKRRATEALQLQETTATAPSKKKSKPKQKPKPFQKPIPIDADRAKRADNRAKRKK